MSCGPISKVDDLVRTGYWARRKLLVINLAAVVATCACTTGCAQTSSSPRPSLACLRDHPPLCYSPSQIRAAYSITPLIRRGITGKGRTIVVIAGSGTSASPKFTAADLGTSIRKYDNIFGLPSTRVSVLSPFHSAIEGGATATELMLDVETAHMTAPGAAIVVVVPKRGISSANLRVKRAALTHQFADLLNATKFAIDNSLGDVISQSYGFGESCIGRSVRRQMHRIFATAQRKRITLIAASGDTGALMPLCSRQSRAVKGLVLPAADPLVTAVGGTTLYASPVVGEYRSEVAWDSTVGGAAVSHVPQMRTAASGGGFSSLIARPDFQRFLPARRGRGVPDVAFSADWRRGFPVVVQRFGRSTDFVLGGTSAAAPAWAGIIALADEYTGRRLGNVNPAIYAVGRDSRLYSRSFHDVAHGNNSATLQTSSGSRLTVRGFAAQPGWDPVTGWGTPKVSALIPIIARDHHA
jgi:subtilase family serine protease